MARGAGASALARKALPISPPILQERCPRAGLLEIVLNRLEDFDALGGFNFDQRAVAQFGEEGVIDILGIAGYYAMLAMIMNVARTALPDGAPYPLKPMPY